MISNCETISNKNTSLFYTFPGAYFPFPTAYFLTPGFVLPVVTLDLILLISFLVWGESCVRESA